MTPTIVNDFFKLQLPQYFLYVVWAEHAGLGMIWSEIRKTGFLASRPVYGNLCYDEACYKWTILLQ